jgi:hypothetical protein
VAFIWRFYTYVTLVRITVARPGLGDTDQKMIHYTIIAIRDQSRRLSRIHLTVSL